VWGSNSRGECGRSSSDAFLPKPTKLANLPGPVAHIAAGHQVSACILQDGRVFTWGSGTKGKLGRACAKSFDPVPTPIALNLAGGELPKSVHFGITYGGVVTTHGRVFAFGANNCSQLGRPASQLAESFQPILVDFTTTVDDDQFIEQISCSKGEFHNHTLALTRSGKIWVFGDNYKAKLGTGLEADCNVPTLLPELCPGDPVVQVAAGGIHSAALLRSGAVYTWGCGSDGRLGHPECKGHRYLYKEEVPRRVDGIKQVSQLVCCYYSCLTISTFSDK
jgi:regulator of chromosome condensation